MMWTCLFYLLGERAVADFIREDMEKRGGMAMIPTKRNRLIQLPVDPAIYGAAQYGRTLLQQAQKCSTPRNPLRQNLRQLPRLHPYSLNSAMDARICQQILSSKYLFS
jgi:hypothetical protein